MFFDDDNAPRLRYNKLKEEFKGKYLNSEAWDHECDTKEIIQAYQDLLKYLEETDKLRYKSRSLNFQIPKENINLV